MAAATLSLSSWAGTLYVCGDGTGLGWTPATPKEIVSETDQYEFTIANLTSFKMSTAKGDWNTFNGGAIGYRRKSNGALDWRLDYKCRSCG